MMLITKNRTLRALVERANARAGVREEELLVVWNARIRLDGNCVVMESACPIYLDQVVEQLRFFTGRKPLPPGHFVWVRSRRKGSEAWRVAGSRPDAVGQELARKAALRGEPMKLTATQLVTQFTCPFLRFVSYEIKEPLPVWGTRRRFGNVIHAAIAEYERRGRSLDRALGLLEEQRSGLTSDDLAEARSILLWRHERALGREGRPVLIEGLLRAQLGGQRLEVRMDRLDGVGSEYLLAEYKGGKSVDLGLVRVQLMILSTAILDVFGRAPGRWVIELLRARKLLDLPAETDPGTLRGFTRGVIEGIRGGDREPRPYDPTFCKRCPARTFCPRVTPRPLAFTRKVPTQNPQLSLF